MCAPERNIMFENGAPNPDIVHYVDTVSREKGLEKEEVFAALELALHKVAQQHYGEIFTLKVHVHRHTGLISYFRCLRVVDTVQDADTEIAVTEAMTQDDTLDVGSEYREMLPSFTLKRTGAQLARGILQGKLKECEKHHEYTYFHEKKGGIVSGSVKRIELNNVILDLGKGEGFLPRRSMIPRENYRVGDRVVAYVEDVRSDLKGYQVILSRTHNEFLAKLFAQEVPEIYDGVVGIRAIARDPGSRAKMAVYSQDASVDPVRTCVGLRGGRIQAVMRELGDEKIDLILWQEDIVTLVAEALKPASVLKVIVNDRNDLDVVVPDDQQSLAIGRGGQNVVLAHKLALAACEASPLWEGGQLSINIMTESEEGERRNTETQGKMDLFQQSLGVTDVMARLLIAEGFDTLEDIAYCEDEELENIEGLSPEDRDHIQGESRRICQKIEEDFRQDMLALGAEPCLLDLNLASQVVQSLVKGGIKSRTALAQLSSWDVQELCTTLKESEAESIVLNARNIVKESHDNAS